MNGDRERRASDQSITVQASATEARHPQAIGAAEAAATNARAPSGVGVPEGARRGGRMIWTLVHPHCASVATLGCCLLRNCCIADTLDGRVAMSPVKSRKTQTGLCANRARSCEQVRPTQLKSQVSLHKTKHQGQNDRLGNPVGHSRGSALHAFEPRTLFRGLEHIAPFLNALTPRGERRTLIGIRPLL